MASMNLSILDSETKKVLEVLLRPKYFYIIEKCFTALNKEEKDILASFSTILDGSFYQKLVSYMELSNIPGLKNLKLKFKSYKPVLLGKKYNPKKAFKNLHKFHKVFTPSALFGLERWIKITSDEFELEKIIYILSRIWNCIFEVVQEKMVQKKSLEKKSVEIRLNPSSTCKDTSKIETVEPTHSRSFKKDCVISKIEKALGSSWEEILNELNGNASNNNLEPSDIGYDNKEPSTIILQMKDSMTKDCVNSHWITSYQKYFNSISTDASYSDSILPAGRTHV